MALTGNNPDVHQQVNEYMNCSICVGAVEHSAVRRTEVLIHKATWMDLKYIMLSERNQEVSFYTKL